MDYFSLVNNALSSDDRALAKENENNEAVDCPNISVIGASGDGPETESNQDARPPTTDNDVKERDENYNRDEECPQAKGICLDNDKKQLELARTDVGDVQQERTKLYGETVTNCRKLIELVTTDANANGEGHVQQQDRDDRRRSMSTPSSPSHVTEIVEKIEDARANIGDASITSAINGGGSCGGAGSTNENQQEKSNRYKEIAEEFLKVCYEDEIVQNNFLRQYNQIFEKVIRTVLDSSSAADNPTLTVKTIRAKYDEQRKIVHAERNAQRNNLKVLIQEMLASETPLSERKNNQEVTSATNEVGRHQQQQQQQQQQRWSTFSCASKLDEERQQVLLRPEDKDRCNGNYCCLKSTSYNCSSNPRFASQMISNHPRNRPAFHYRLAAPVSQMNFQNHAFSTSAARTRRHSAIISRFSNANRTNAINAAPGRFQNKSHGLNSVGFINSNSSEVINWRSREPVVVASAAATASSGAVSVGNEEDGRIVSSSGAAATNEDDPTNENDWFGYKKHPTQLVHEICGKNLSVSCTTISMNSKPLHEVTYKVGSDTFHAIAETKKEAKRRCAIRVLKSINILH